MSSRQVEYVGFRSSETTRDYRLRVRNQDGQCHEFTLVIQQEAFLAHRVRYQDAAEICFWKLSRALQAGAANAESDPLAGRLDVTDADLLEYREAHTPKPRGSALPRPVPPPPTSPDQA